MGQPKQISVVIPAYNAEATIQAALNSVNSQTSSPFEVLVFNDGSNDKTALILESYKSNTRVFTQTNQGVAHARNYLCGQARGDYVAFLDADDIWHSHYLEILQNKIDQYPSAVGYFTDHVNFVGLNNYVWDSNCMGSLSNSQLITPEVFIQQYDKSPLSFQMSGCCVPKKIIIAMGDEPFPESVSGADDTYFHNILPLYGAVLYTDYPLTAYRIMDSSISANRLKMAISVVEAFKLLEKHYQSQNQVPLYNIFKLIFASRHRNCGKFMMGSGRSSDARMEFKEAIKISCNLNSVLKSLILLSLTYLPNIIKLKWPSGNRNWEY